MDFYQFLLIIKARYKIILITFISIVLSTILYNIFAPKEYTASVSLVLNYKGVDPVTGIVLPAQLMPGYMATQIDIITSRIVANKVVKKLRLDSSPVIQEQYQENKTKNNITDWISQRISTKLDIKPSRESSVIQIIYSGADPDFVALVANTFAEAYQEANIELKIDPAKKAAAFLSKQMNQLRGKLESTQSDLSKYQHERGITNVNGGLDVELIKLNGISSQLVVAQSRLYDTKSRHTSSRRSNNAPDIASNPVIQNLKMTIAIAEAKFSDLSQRFGEKHPQYISANAELNKQKRLLNSEIKKTSGSINESYKIDKQKVNQLQSAYTVQKNKLLKINAARDDLAVLQNEVFSAQKALDVASTRYNQTNQESNSNQSDITILNAALAPDTPSSPKVLINIVLSIFIGTILGVAIGLIIELLDRRVRSDNDVLELLEIPVFAVIKGRSNNKSKLISNNTKRLLNFKL